MERPVVRIGLLLVLVCSVWPAGTASATPQAPREVIGLEDWEDGFDNDPWVWTVDNGLWDVGVPTAGPGEAHSGTMCVATVPGGDYPNLTSSRLILNSLDLTGYSLAPGEELRLYFWQWFEIGYEGGYYNDYDLRRFQVRPEGESWATLEGDFTRDGAVWSRSSLDLSAYAGQRVDVGFYLYQDPGDNQTKAGWYIDDVSPVSYTHLTLPTN